jgi:FkbM family methyltransferase
MNLATSFRAFLRTASTDLRMRQHGARLGWYLTTHYKARFESRLRKPASVAKTSLNVNSVSIDLYITPQHLGTLLGVFLDGEYNLAEALPDFTPSRVLDLGANVGMAAAYLHAFYPDAEYICVEPDPRNQSLLEQTLKSNNIRSTLVRAAVAARAGTLQLRMGENPSCSALETSPMHALDSSTEVSVLTVPELLDRAGWSQVDLVKIDIEGTERELLSQNNDWLDRVSVIVLEIHPNTSAAEIARFIEPFGFKLARLSYGAEPVYLATRS